MEKASNLDSGGVRGHGHASYRRKKRGKLMVTEEATCSAEMECQNSGQHIDFDVNDEPGRNEEEQNDVVDEPGINEEEGDDTIRKEVNIHTTREDIIPENDNDNHRILEQVMEGVDPIPKQKAKPKSRKQKGVDVRVINSVPKTGPYPGGPSNNSILSSFYDHVALKVWFGEERGALKIIHHTKKLMQWEMKPEWVRFNNKVRTSGFGDLRDSLSILDKSLVSAFCERWHAETSSFHMPFGEMTITLDDVLQITGLPIEGDIVVVSCDMTYEEGVALVHRCLGLEESEIKKELGANKTLTVKNSWIKQRLSGQENVNDDAKVDCAVRGYLLYCIGCTLCPDKTTTRVPIAYLRYLEKLDEVSKIPWGAIALAFLYKELGSASKGDVMQIAGFLALLEVWIFEHFPSFFYPRSMKPNYEEPQPRMKRWRPCPGIVVADEYVISYRERIDNMTENDVIWDPYYEHRQTTRVLPEITFYEGQLRCLDVKVPYLPNRVMRQFGLVQSIPCDVVSSHGDYYNQWVNHVLAPEKRVRIQPNEPDCVPGYKEWFAMNSHIHVQNPEKYKGPRKSGPMAPSNSGIDVNKIHNAQNILEKLLQKGKQWCGKSYVEIMKARDQLLLCGAGTSTSEAIPAEEDDQEPCLVQRKGKTNKRMTKKSKR